MHARLNISWASGDTNPGLVYGFIVMTSSTALSGVADPAVSLEEDWMLWDTITPGTCMNSTPLPPTTPTAIIGGQQIDIRSKRKMHQLGERFVFVMTNQGSAAVSFSLTVRTLVMLP